MNQIRATCGWTRKNKYKWVLAEDKTCECEKEQDVKHIFGVPTLKESVAKKIWIRFMKTQ